MANKSLGAPQGISAPLGIKLDPSAQLCREAAPGLYASLGAAGFLSLVPQPAGATATDSCLRSNCSTARVGHSWGSSGYPVKPRWLHYCSQQPSSKPGRGRGTVPSKEERASAGKRAPLHVWETIFRPKPVDKLAITSPRPLQIYLQSLQIIGRICASGTGFCDF